MNSRKILVGAAVLDLMEHGEIERLLLEKWLSDALLQEKDRILFQQYSESGPTRARNHPRPESERVGEP